jgi:hypothetical protein
VCALIRAIVTQPQIRVAIGEKRRRRLRPGGLLSRGRSRHHAPTAPLERTEIPSFDTGNSQFGGKILGKICFAIVASFSKPLRFMHIRQMTPDRNWETNRRNSSQIGGRKEITGKIGNHELARPRPRRSMQMRLCAL